MLTKKLALFLIQLNKNSEICSNLNSKYLQWCLLTKKLPGVWLHNPKMIPPSSNAVLIVPKRLRYQLLDSPRFLCVFGTEYDDLSIVLLVRLQTLFKFIQLFPVVSCVHAHASINLLAHCSLMLAECTLTRSDRHSYENFAGSTIC